MAMNEIVTLGHGTLGEELFVEVLGDASVRELIDVRRFPGSRRNPQFGQDAMASWLPAAGIEYRHLPALGGRRSGGESTNVGLRNEQFRAYAHHMASDEFAGGVAELESIDSALDEGRVAVMCSESVWWRCHRRLLADHLVLVEGVTVEHLFHDGRLQEHPVTPEARRNGPIVEYPAPE